jgi:citrate lyase subunit beta/citryl-CoA lyase
VLPSEKAEARETVLRFLQDNRADIRSKFVALRINDPASSVGAQDLEAIAKLGGELPLSAIVLPKVESPDAAASASRALKNALPVWCMIETARGVLAAPHIAAVPQVSTLVLGSNDLTKDLRARHTPSREPLLYSMSTCVLAARAHRKAVLDGVHIHIDDDAGLRAACKQARDIGFDGKTLIHPKQVDITNEVFSPSQEELKYAQKVVSAWEAAQQAGTGVVLVDGKLVEQLHVDDAVRLLEMHRQINRRG